MKRLTLALVLLLVTPGPASAYTCEQVREYVRTHTQQEIETMKQRMTKTELAEAQKCLKRSQQ